MKKNLNWMFLFVAFGTAVCVFLFILELTTYQATAGGTTVDIVSWEREGETFWFTTRLQNGLPNASYQLTTVHETDLPYPQQVYTLTTDTAGHASARMWSGCSYQTIPTGTVYANIVQGGTVLTTAPISCPAISYISDYGAHLAGDSAASGWSYRPDDNAVTLWIEDSDQRTGLSGAVRLLSAQGYDSGPLALMDGGNGRYSRTWTLPNSPDLQYRVQFTLDDSQGGHSGLDTFLRIAGRSVWIWGALDGAANPEIWSLLTNGDFDGDGQDDRDQFLVFMDAPHGVPGSYASNSYLSVYPYISHTGYTATAEFQDFLQIAHGNELTIEALAGTYEWVNSDSLLAEGKATCDNILAYNAATGSASRRFDGIHLDVEHDNWEENGRWARFLDLLGHCRTAIDLYNQTHATVTLSADIPPHFLTGAHNSGQVMSNWDVMQLVDSIALMDYRDFAYERWDGRDDGIVPRAEGFMADGNALATAVIIGVELTPNTYNHVTFFEECIGIMATELTQVGTAFATEFAYGGIAMHDYAAWTNKQPCFAFLPLILK